MRVVLEKFKYVVRKIQMLRKENFGKIKYEISTDLPSARARRFKSNGQDFSPVCFILLTKHPAREKQSRMSACLSPSTPFWVPWFLLVWPVVAVRTSGFVA
jgi:hypothetical protein